MKHLSLAAKYRPQTFAQVAGQDMVKAVLSRAAAEDRVAAAYLLSGTRGVGKTTIARIFAKALNCRHAPGPEPCNQCDQCRKITQGSHVDVTEIDGASNNSVEDARALRENIGYAPMEGRYKVFIIDEAHMLSRSAFNALLKTLEEPDGQTVFFLLTAHPEALLPTIRSRCRPVYMPRLPEETIRQELLSRGQTPERAAYAARLSEGVLGRAIALCGQDPYYRCRDEAVALLRALREKADIPKASLAWEERRKPEDSLPFLEAMEAVLRDIVRVQSGLAPFDAQIESELEEFARHFTIEGVACIMEEVVTVRKRVHAHVQWRSAAEPLLRRIVEGAEK